MCKGILTLQLSKGRIVIAYINEVEVTIVAQSIKEIKILTNETIWELRSWLESAGLAHLALNRTKAPGVSTLLLRMFSNVDGPKQIRGSFSRSCYMQLRSRPWH